MVRDAIHYFNEHALDALMPFPGQNGRIAYSVSHGTASEIYTS